jgi:ferric-dicitrate binding protein FerR (iron transport regulator)
MSAEGAIMRHGGVKRAILASFLGTLASVAAAQAPGTCIVTRVDGQVTISARGAGSREAATGLALGRNSTLLTGSAGRVTMSCSGGLEVIVGPQTKLDVLGPLDGGARPFGLRIIDGIAGFLFSGDDDNGVQVRTPSAVAAVRSTQWAMQVDDQSSAIFAREGTVFVFADGGDARLGPGDGVDITPSGEIGPVRRWGQRRIDLFDVLLGPDW